MVKATGTLLDRLGRADRVAVEPMMTAAVAKTAVPVLPGICTIPSLVCVWPMGMMSGTGFGSNDRSIVLTPSKTGAASAFVHLKRKFTVTAAAVADICGCRAMRNVCVLPGAIDTLVFGDPV